VSPLYANTSTRRHAVAKQNRGSDFARTTRVLNLLPTCSLTHLLFARGLQASGFEYDELHLGESISFFICTRRPPAVQLLADDMA
jgi:hypothetical protein